MANTISSTSSSSLELDSLIRKLAPTFQTAISTQIEAESTPLKRVQAQLDEVEVRRGIYTDMKSNLDALQSAVQALISTQDTYDLKLGASLSVSPYTTGTTVFSATSDDKAGTGEYEISVTDIAKAHSQATTAVASADLALGKSGIFWMGGSGTASVNDFIASTSVTGAELGTVETGQRELGSTLAGEAYSLQVRDFEGTRQFRLTNTDGSAMSIRKTDGTGYTDAWQVLAGGDYDTGRGLKVALSASGSPGSTAIKYTAKGSSITITASDTMRTISAAINAATQPEGHDFKASIVANALVITAGQSGQYHSALYTDGAGLGFSDLQAGQNATFKVNGMTISRSRNSGLTDVIDGVTLNLAGDAKGNSGKLSLVVNNDKANTAMNALVNKFNAAVTHLTQKMAITSKTDGTKTTYSRAPMTGDSIISGLRSEMYSRVSRSYSNSGSFKRLDEIGLGMDKDMKLTIDSTKFADAIKNRTSDVTALLDTAMGGFDTMMTSYAGGSGAIQRSLSSIDDQKKTYDLRVASYNKSLTNRKQALYDNYLLMQFQLVEMSQQVNLFNMFNGTSTGTSVDTTG